MAAKLEVWDYVAVAVYFVAVLAAGLYSLCRSNRGTVSGYFLAGRYMIWLSVGASMFASNIGSEHFIGLAGSGAAGGLGVGAFEFNALLILQLLGWVYLPVFIASGVCTLPEFMRKRFGGQRIRVYLSCLSILLYIFTKVSVNMYSGALFIQLSLGWSLYLSILLLLAMTALCTVTGGLAAVIYTDTLQAFIMVLGGVVLMILSFIRVGGYQGLVQQYPLAIPNTTLASNSTCGVPKDDAFIILRDPVNSDMPWPGFLFGQTPASMWYWCADQMMVQRALAAKSLSHAQGGTLLAGYLKMFPMFMIVIPGMISRVLFKDEVGCVDPDVCREVCGNPAGCSNTAYPRLVLEVMPTGLRGVMMAVMLAALMSDLTSIFNSASTLFTMDIYKRIRTSAKVRELMVVGRAFVLVMVAIGIAWIPLIQEMQGGQLFLYIQAISAYLAPPIAAVYIVAILWKRGNEKGAFCGLMVGLVVGLIRMVLDFIYREPVCGEPDMRPPVVRNFHYMYFAMLLFFLTLIIMVTVSLLTEPLPAYMLVRTTFWTRFDKSHRLDELELESENPELAEHESSAEMSVPSSNTSLKDSESKIVEGVTKVTMTEDSAQKLMGVPQTVTQEEDSCCVQMGRMLQRGFIWFCGIDTDMQGHKHAMENQQHLAQISTLQQNPLARTFLNVNLIFICTLAVAVYIFFSIPPTYLLPGENVLPGNHENGQG